VLVGFLGLVGLVGLGLVGLGLLGLGLLGLRLAVLVGLVGLV
jgi:hypothetical protein